MIFNIKVINYFTQKRTLSLIILNILIAALYWFVFLSIQWIQQETTDTLSFAETDLQRDETFRSIETIITNSSSELNLIESYFVSQNGVVDFIESVERLATLSEIDVTINFIDVENASSPSSEKSAEFYEMLHIKMITEGTWHDTVHFLSLLENVPYKVDIQRTSFVFVPQSENALSFSSSGSGDNRTWRGNFDFTVLKLRENARN